MEKELVPGFKLRTQNKAALVGLAADPHDPSLVYVVTVDGNLMCCRVVDNSFIPLESQPVPFVATQERVRLHARSHPGNPGHTMVVVEAERSGITILESSGPGNLIINTTLRTGTGGVLAGVGIVSSSSLLVAAVKQARGNVGFFVWKLLFSKHGVLFQACNASPSSLWAALDGESGQSTVAHGIADAGGDSVIGGAIIHAQTGTMAFWTIQSHQSSAISLRIPILNPIDSSQEAGGVGSPGIMPLHTSPTFWVHASSEHDHIVSDLYFPRSAFLYT